MNRLALFLLFGLTPLIRAQPMSVCELLSRLADLNGKLVEVRGAWQSGDTGESLWATSTCEYPTIRDGWQFIDAIQVGPRNGRLSARAYYARLREIARSHPGTNVVVTVSGKLRVPERFEVWWDPIGHQERLRAFNNIFVAELSYLSVSDFKAVQVPPLTLTEIERLRYPQPQRVR